jgi:hypothetical protein
MKNTLQNDGVLVVGSCRPKWSGVPRAGIRDATSDERKFNPDSSVTASSNKSVTGNSTRNQGNNPSSNRVSGYKPGFQRVPNKTVYAFGWGLKLDSQQSCTWKTRDYSCKSQFKGDPACRSEGISRANRLLKAGRVSPASEYLASNGALGRA